MVIVGRWAALRYLPRSTKRATFLRLLLRTPLGFLARKNSESLVLLAQGENTRYWQLSPLNAHCVLRSKWLFLLYKIINLYILVVPTYLLIYLPNWLYITNSIGLKKCFKALFTNYRSRILMLCFIHNEVLSKIGILLLHNISTLWTQE